MSIPIRSTKSSPGRSGGEKILTKLPAKEICWVKSISENGTIFYTTSNPERTMYFLYKVTPEGLRKVGKSPTPAALDAMIYPAQTISKRAKKTTGK